MGTIVRAGSGRGVVVATGSRTQFGAIAAGLSVHQLDTAFQVGLRRFSMLLVYVAGALTSLIFVANVVLQQPFIDALLFSLAIAVGISPQLLPAVVATSLAAGSRHMLRRKVLVKRLVCIEDLGDIDTLFTDKTGTLTLGQVTYARAIPEGAARSDDVLRAGLLCSESVTTAHGSAGGNPLDQALAESPAASHLTPALTTVTPTGRDPVRPRAADGLRAGPRRPDDNADHQGCTGDGPRALRRRPTGSPHRTDPRVRRRQPGRGCRNPAVHLRPVAARRRVTDSCCWVSWSSSTRPSRMLPRHWSAWRAWASPSRSSPATTPPSPRRCATTWGSREMSFSPAPTSTPSPTLTCPRPWTPTTVFARVSPEHKARIVRGAQQRRRGGLPRRRGQRRAGAAHALTSGSRSTPAPTWPRTPPT